MLPQPAAAKPVAIWRACAEPKSATVFSFGAVLDEYPNRKETDGSALNSWWFVEIIARLLRPKPRQLISTLSNLHNSNPSGI